MARRLVAGWFFVEAVATAIWIAELLPSMTSRDLVVWTLVTLRGGVGVTEFSIGTTLGNARAAIPAAAPGVPIASALLAVVEIGFRLAPTNLDPTYRWWLVAAYATGASALALWLARQR
jgi:hypothetical protein